MQMNSIYLHKATRDTLRNWAATHSAYQQDKIYAFESIKAAFNWPKGKPIVIVQYNLKQRCSSERFKSFTIRQHDPKVIFLLSLHWFVLYLPFSRRMCACGCEVKQPQMEKTCAPLFIMKKIAPFWKQGQ